MIKSGFFTSRNGDRKYSAEDISQYFKGIISSGVLAETGSSLQVTADGTGMTVYVQPGRGFIESFWIENTAAYPRTVSVSEIAQDRIDTVVMIYREENRQITLEYIRGVPAATPVHPDIVRSAAVKSYRLADIRVKAGVTAVTQADITDTRASADCGWVTGLIDQVDTSTLFLQWQKAYEKYYADSTSEFSGWLNYMKNVAAKATIIKTFSNVHITAQHGETLIPVGIPEYVDFLDVLRVHINGIRLVPGEEYTAEAGNCIRLKYPVDINTPVEFEVIKTVDGSEAQTVTDLVFQLRQILNKTKITDSEGGAKLTHSSRVENCLDAFLAAGKGFHTMHVAAGAVGAPGKYECWIMGHIISEKPAEGYVLAVQEDGSAYCNVIISGTWKGWRTLYSKEAAVLFERAVGAVTEDGEEIIPEKPLSECQHGWELVFSGVNPVEDTQVFHIPKKYGKGKLWNGEKSVFLLTYGDQAAETPVCRKIYEVYDSHIISAPQNSAGNAGNTMLRMILEY